MESEQILALSLSILSTGVVVLFISVILLHGRVRRIENLPSVRDFLKLAKTKKRKK